MAHLKILGANMLETAGNRSQLPVRFVQLLRRAFLVSMIGDGQQKPPSNSPKKRDWSTEFTQRWMGKIPVVLVH